MAAVALPTDGKDIRNGLVIISIPDIYMTSKEMMDLYLSNMRNIYR